MLLTRQESFSSGQLELHEEAVADQPQQFFMPTGRGLGYLIAGEATSSNVLLSYRADNVCGNRRKRPWVQALLKALCALPSLAAGQEAVSFLSMRGGEGGGLHSELTLQVYWSKLLLEKNYPINS